MKNIVQKIAALKIGKHYIVKKRDIAHPYTSAVREQKGLRLKGRCISFSSGSRDALAPQMSHPLTVNETQVELSKETKTTLCLGDPIVRVFLRVFIRAGGVGPFNGHVLP